MDPVIQEWGDNIIEIEWTEISGHGTEGTRASAWTSHAEHYISHLGISVGQ